MKIFHFRDKIDSLPRTVNKIMAPIHIRIKPTNVCNHSCSYCAYRTENLQLGKDMIKKDYIPKEKMIEIIYEIAEMGVEAITFSGGGEPFCYPYLLEVLKKLSKTKVKFAALTNGSRLKGEIAEIFAHYGTWLRVSIDGWDNISYSSYRRVPEKEFTKVMRNMENFTKLEGKCHLGVSFIVDKNNSQHIYDFIKMVKSVGVDSVKISPCIVNNDGAENKRYHHPVVCSVKEQTKKAMIDLADDTFEIFDAYHELDERYKKEYDWCPYLQILPVIGADLNIYSCQDKAYNFEEGLIGSIKNQGFKDFWFFNKEKFFKINPAINCNHHCVANYKNKLILKYLNADRNHLGFV